MIEHPARRALHNEVHARPPEPMQAPVAISHMVMLTDASAREASRAHLMALLHDHHLPVPQAHTNHLRADLGNWRLRRSANCPENAWHASTSGPNSPKT